MVNMLAVKVFEWLVIAVGRKTHGEKEFDARKSKVSFIGLWTF